MSLSRGNSLSRTAWSTPRCVPLLLGVARADEQYGMGSGGYTGLKVLGNISITVGSKTSTHLAMISEEEHFDVVLGRTWLEKTGIK